MEKLVSVCINSYNKADVVLETVNSVLNQTYKNLQVIIVDDCSTDNSVEILKTVTDPRVELYVLPTNGGVSACNNETFKYVKGDYVAHLDSDDIWVPEKIEKQVAFLESHKEYGACFSYSGEIDEVGNIINDGIKEKATTYNYKNRTQAEYVRLLFDELNHFNHSAFIIRKEILKKLGNHNLTLKFLHDFDLWTRLILIAPVYVLEEPLVYCRVNEKNLSYIVGDNAVAHTEELARIDYNLINNCPDDMLLTAFADKLKFGGKHTHTETEFERAFILSNCVYALNNDAVLKVKKLDELMSAPENIAVAKEKFGFTLKDLYEMHKSPVFYDADELNHYKNLYTNNTTQIAQLYEKIGVLESRLADAENGIPPYLLRLPCVKVYVALKRVKNALGEVKSLFSKKLQNGKKAKSVYTVFGYLSHNVGDDLFFDTLFKRYPDTLFKITAPADCYEFFSRYSNVRYYDWSRKLVAQVNRIGARLNLQNPFERLLIKTSNGAIHIGGSIYQQVGDWQNDINIRKYRLVKGKEYYSVSSNFGPYTTSEYFDFWQSFFKGSTDICFREKYSYNLFKDIKSVRYAPDLLFGFNYGGEIKCEKSIAISVIDTFLSARNIEKSIAENYENLITSVVRKYCRMGYNVDLLGFCVPEGDCDAIDRIVAKLPNEKINKIVYNGTDFEPILKSIATSEIVIASRFHAMVLGYVIGKKVLNITYSKKTDNVIYDLVLDNNPLTLNDLGNKARVFEILNNLSPTDISVVKEQAKAQFSVLDEKITSRHGRVEK